MLVIKKLQNVNNSSLNWTHILQVVTASYHHLHDPNHITPWFFKKIKFTYITTAVFQFMYSDRILNIREKTIKRWINSYLT